MYDVGIMGNGALAGLVAITSGTSTVYPWAAIIIGLVAGALYCAGSRASIAMHVSSTCPCRPPWCQCCAGCFCMAPAMAGMKADGRLVVWLAARGWRLRRATLAPCWGSAVPHARMHAVLSREDAGRP